MICHAVERNDDERMIECGKERTALLKENTVKTMMRLTQKDCSPLYYTFKQEVIVSFALMTY